MPNETWNPSLVAILRHAIRVWRLRMGGSREAVATRIMAMLETVGHDQTGVLGFEPLERMPAERVRLNTERVFRWLDDDNKDDDLLPVNVLPALLAALPLDLRMMVANALLVVGGLQAEMRSDGESVLCMGRLLRRVLNANAEAAAAMAQAMQDTDAMRDALRALGRGIAAMQDAAASLEAHAEDMTRRAT